MRGGDLNFGPLHWRLIFAAISSAAISQAAKGLLYLSVAPVQTDRTADHCYSNSMVWGELFHVGLAC